MSTLLIKNATIVNEHRQFVGSILVTEGRISSVTDGFNENIGGKQPMPDRVVDAEGLLCLPGIIDDQVHFREPGLTHKGDIESESLAAIMGGVTSYMEMPNTLPQTTTMEAWEDKMERARRRSHANYSFYMGATNDNIHVLSEMDLRHTPGLKVFMGSSTGNMLVDNEETLRRIFQECPIIVAIHSESEEVIRANRARIVAQYGEDPDISLHPVIRDERACYESTLKAVNLAKETGCRLHILHLSTAKELTLLDGVTPLNEKNITAEVCVHHLWFDDESYRSLGSRVKWNPAVKSREDRDALREAVHKGLVDVIATDHAPHLLSEKSGGALKAASGGPLVEHSLPMMLELASQGVFTVEEVVDFMCHRPATLFGVVDRGFIREGYLADLVLVDPNRPWVLDQSTIHSKCGWSPLEGVIFQNRVVMTILNGNIVVENGRVIGGIGAAQPLEFNHRTRKQSAL